MEHRITAWKAAATTILGALTALWGWFGWLLLGWVGLMLLDFLTGSAAAAKGGSWSSQAARDGVWHKAGMVVVTCWLPWCWTTFLWFSFQWPIGASSVLWYWYGIVSLN